LATPFIYDVDGDGDNDIVCGRRDGTLNWYINYGTPQNPQFSPDSVIHKWGKINLTGFYEIEGCSQPVIRRENGSLFLYSGSNRGSVFKFLIPNQQIRSDSFLLVDSNFLRTYVGRKSTIAIADFNGDEVADVVTGNASGGLDFFSSKLIDLDINDLPEETAIEWSIFPNPASRSFSIFTESNQANFLEVFSITGEKVLEKNIFRGERISTQEWASGIYLVKLHQEVKRLVVLK
jgi:hypothetical protein